MTTALIENCEARCVHKLFGRLLPFLFLLYCVNYLDRINVGFAKLQMQAQLGFSERVFGLGFGIFLWGILSSGSRAIWRYNTQEHDVGSQ